MAVRQASHGHALRRRRGASRGVSAFQVQHILYFLVGMTLFATFLLVFFLLPSSSSSHKGILRRRHVKKLPIPETDNVHNSLAQDIINSLGCESLQNPDLLRNNDDGLDDDENDEYPQNRRLEQVTDDFEFEDDRNNDKEEAPLMDDDVNIPMDGDVTSLNAKHAMCLVAGSPNLPSFIRKEGFSCNLMEPDKRQALLETWSSARTQMSLSLIQKTLEMAQESPATLLNYDVNMWMPAQDSSLEFLTNTLNDESSPIRNLPLEDTHSVFIDVGSGLGFTTLAVAKEYPNTHILSLEPASPSWLLQQLNLICNLNSNDIVPVLAGVGASQKLHDGMAKVLWRPSQTRLTRTWTRKNETSPEDLELLIHVRRLLSVVAEYTADYLQDLDIHTRVLNLDCEGCEYNVVPSMTEKEREMYTHMIGTTGVHWGYIPMDKLPSSKRAETTHKVLCGYQDYARQCMECCAFPTLQVKGMRDDGSGDEQTVQEVSGDLCRGFDEFAESKLLFASNDDYGWMELSSMSDVVEAE